MNKHTEKILKINILEGLKFGRRKKDKNDYTFQKEQKKLIKFFFDIFGTFEKRNINYEKQEEEFFGKLNNSTKKEILDFIKNPDSLDDETKEKVKEIGKKIFLLLSSVDTKIPKKNIKYYIQNEMKSSGLALERFILYSIAKFCKNKNISVENTKAEFEPNKIDFISIYKKINVKNEKEIIFAIQLTITEGKNYLNQKKIDLEKLTKIIDNPFGESFNKQPELSTKNFRKEKISDIAILFIINGSIGKLVRNKKNNSENPFLNAYRNIGKKELLKNFSNKDEKLFELIGKSYPILVENTVNQLKKINLEKDYKQEKIKSAHGIIDIFYDSNKKTYKINFYQKLISNNHSFLYSLEFFITKKFLKKIKR